MAIPICKLVNVFLSIRFLICRHLCEVVEVLDHRGLQRICYVKKKKESVNLSEKQSVRDGLAHHEGGDKVLNSARLSTVGAEVERVETSEQAGEMKYFRKLMVSVPLCTQLVQNRDVGISVVDVIGVRRVLVPRPLVRRGHV